MSTLQVPARPRADRTSTEARSHPVIHDDKPNAGPLEGELLDIYGAILIAIPLALFLKSLWF